MIGYSPSTTHTTENSSAYAAMPIPWYCIAYTVTVILALFYTNVFPYKQDIIFCQSNTLYHYHGCNYGLFLGAYCSSLQHLHYNYILLSPWLLCFPVLQQLSRGGWGKHKLVVVFCTIVHHLSSPLYISASVVGYCTLVCTDKSPSHPAKSHKTIQWKCIYAAPSNPNKFSSAGKESLTLL